MPIAYVFPRGGSGSPTAPSLSLTAPPPLSVAAGQTTGSLVSSEATGGTGPYTYDAAISFDSSGSGTATITGISGRTISLAYLSNGLYLEITITATDSLGATASVVASVLVASVAAGTMTPGAFPASQLLATTETTASVAFNVVGGSFTAPVTYVATVQSGTAGISNVDTAVSLTGLTADSVVLVRLRATDSTGGTPLVADAYALVEVSAATTNPLIWQTIREIDFTATGNAQGPFINGSQAVSLVDANTSATLACTLIHSMNSGSFSNITSEILDGVGWKQSMLATGASTSTDGPILIPLPSAIGYDDDIRVTIVGIANHNVGGLNSYWQMCKTGATPNANSSNAWGGVRLLRNGVSTTVLTISAQSGTSGSNLSQVTTPPCPLTWMDGSTELTVQLYLPRYGTRARVNMSGTGSSINCDLGSASVSASSTALRGGWIAGNTGVWLFHGIGNGAVNGLGLQYSIIKSIKIERRTLP
jgi:hypothetical protein